MSKDTDHRDPMVILGAIRGHLDALLHVYATVPASASFLCTMPRMEELATELEASLTAQMFENSCAFDKAVIERIKQAAETVGKARR